ncbi:hypothetical protein [Roseovarius sp. M141]|uniref:hypothetical protein n=1 Tax=Roseovarius sp. M141 TaxID=2583806 RepID=UPI0020CE2BB7|nr:hypothetical protein [Roseovarius sp. M141]MCQ0092067.1 hypothetical protein [Roseovarius sp. M141]
MVIVVGLIVAFVLVLIFSDRKTRNCRWREDRTLDAGNGRAYRCMACGALTHTTDGKPPKDCKADDKAL